jgi:hypothetical protein
MGHILKLISASAMLAATALAMSAPADAGSCRGHRCKLRHDGDGSGIYRYVTAEASTGFGTVTGPVRPGRWGDQVQLPGGSWADCESSCEYTLRRWTVDFWEGQSHHFVSPGYFRFDLDLDTGAIYRRRPY